MKQGLLNKKWFLITLLLLLPLIVYLNSLNNAFHYDDMSAFVKNEAIRDIRNIPGFFKAVIAGEGEINDLGYRPLLDISFMLNYYIGGLNPAGYHIFNLLFHILNGLLIYFVVGMTGDFGKNKIVPFIAALAFVMHPVHSEAVNYIHARSSILATFFMLLALFLFIKHKASGPGKLIYYSGAIGAFVAGVLTKELVFTLPVMLCLYDYYFISGGRKAAFLKNALKQHLPFFILLGIYLVFRVLLVKNLNPPDDTKTPLTYLLTQTRVMMNYIKLLFYPVNLAVERRILLSHSFFELRVMFSTAVIALALFAALKLYRKSKALSFGIFWFFITLIPTSSVVPLIIIMNEHRLYLPGVGFSLVIAVLVHGLWNMPPGKFPVKRFREALAVLLVLVLIFSFMRILKRNGDWKDEYSLWSKNVKVCPDSFRARNNLGAYYDRQDDYDNAMKHYEESVRLNPMAASSQDNLGIIYYKKGFYDRAIVCYKNALALKADYHDALNNLGIVYAAKGMLEEAISEFEKVIDINPEHKSVYKNLGLVYKMMKDEKRALIYWKKYLQVYPDAPDAGLIKGEINKMGADR